MTSWHYTCYLHKGPGGGANGSDLYHILETIFYKLDAASASYTSESCTFDAKLAACIWCDEIFFRRDLKLEKIEEVLQKRDKALPPQHHLILDLKLELLARYEKIRHGDLELIG